MAKEGTSCGTNAGNAGKTDSSCTAFFPARVVNQNAGFALSCTLARPLTPPLSQHFALIE